MNDLPTQIERTVREQKLFRRGERILVAVSGGLDSMALLHLLAGLAESQRWQLRVAHFNHQLRGRASDSDERFVKRAAGKLGLPFASGRADVRSAADAQGESLEMAARRLRHRFLAQTARRWTCNCIALAHHADDQVELFFIRLLRGAGPEGLGGMKRISPSPADRSIRLVRPLLATGREELRAFAAEECVQFREDASNDSREILRNRIRHELLPLLQREYQPAIRKLVERVMELVIGDAEVVIEAARTALRMKPRTIAGWPIGLQRRIIQVQLRRRGVAANYQLIELLRTRTDQTVSITPQLSVLCDPMGRLRFLKPQAVEFHEGMVEVDVSRGAGEVSFGGLELSWQRQNSHGDVRRSAGSGLEYFDADSLGPRIILRHWRPGDRFQPIGLKHEVKLQDWFTNRKVPHARRRELVIATSVTGQIFWVEGQRIGEPFKLTTATRRRLVLRWKRA